MSRTERSLIPFEELIKELSVGDFEGQAARIVRRLDRDGTRVDCSFDRGTRSSSSKASPATTAYYRAEVARIPSMGREEELRFCMGVELLWRRLKKARRAAGMPHHVVEVYPGTEDSGCLDCQPGRELICEGCSPAAVGDELRARVRDCHSEFVAARNELMERNLHIVFRLLERYRNVAVAPEDLIQEANLSLFKAIQGFDFTRGVRFKTYAGYWVNQAFLNAIYNQSRTVRVPAYIQKAMKKLNDATSSVEGGLRDAEALSRRAGMDVESVETTLRGNRYTLSLDMTVDPSSGARMVDLLEREQEDGQASLFEDEDSALHAHLGEAIARLSVREQKVLRLRFGLDGEVHTLSEVGRQLGISLERVRQIQNGALEKMRLGTAAPLLEQFA